MSFVAALAVKSVINNNINCNVKFKWPNDLMIDLKKVSGILLEPTDDKKAIIIGIGINLISNPEIKGNFWKSTNLYDVSGFKLIPENLSLELLEQIINFVNIWYEQGFEYIKTLWLKNVLFLKQELHSTDLKNRVIGKFLGINDLGQMIIKDKTNNSLNISSGTFIPINQ